MDKTFKENITAKETWLRGFFIFLFAFLLTVARIVTWAVVVLQFLFSLFAGKPNENLLALGANLSRYIYQCMLFVTFNSDIKPFPFAEWPSDDEQDVVSTKAVPKKATVKKTTVKKAGRKKAATKKPETGNTEAQQPAQQDAVTKTSEPAVSDDADSENAVVESKAIEQTDTDITESGEENEKPSS